MLIYLSIIIPYFNSIKNLRKNLSLYEKLLNQKINLELIFVNDNSSDSSQKFLSNKFSSNPRVKLLKLKKNFGPGIARNLGIKKSKSKRILFLDSDDTLNVNNLIKLLKVYKKSKKNIFFNYKKNKNNFNIIKKTDSFNVRLKKYFTDSVDLECLYICYNKNFLLKNKIFFKDGYHEDVFFMFLVYLKMKYQIEKFDKIVYIKNSNETSITNNFGLKNINGWINALININDQVIKDKQLNKKIMPYFQFRLRGEFYNLIENIKKSKYNRKIKKKFEKIVYKKLIKLIDLNNKPNILSSTYKDLETFKMVKKYLK